MKGDFHIIIPARYHSVRFPKKLLMDLHGMTVIERVYRQALLAAPKSVVIATDHADIFNLATSFGATVMMTDVAHPTGTDRIAEAARSLNLSPHDIVVNVQGDEPLIPPALIRQVAQVLMTSSVPMATLCWPLQDYSQSSNPNVVKVVRDRFNNALYFSRSMIPANRDAPLQVKHMLRHIGLYAYRADFLQALVSQPVCELEATEALEPLRVLWSGETIRVETASVEPMQDINMPEDLETAHNILAAL